jgi:hypothetical protein
VKDCDENCHGHVTQLGVAVGAGVAVGIGVAVVAGVGVIGFGVGVGVAGGQNVGKGWSGGNFTTGTGVGGGGGSTGRGVAVATTVPVAVRVAVLKRIGALVGVFPGVATSPVVANERPCVMKAIFTPLTMMSSSATTRVTRLRGRPKRSRGSPPSNAVGRSLMPVALGNRNVSSVARC